MKKKDINETFSIDDSISEGEKKDSLSYGISNYKSNLPSKFDVGCLNEPLPILKAGSFQEEPEVM